MKTLTCPIASITALGAGVRRVVLDLPEPVEFSAGQYLEIHLASKTCPFSIASAPASSRQIELHVRPTPNSEDSDEIEALLDRVTELTVDIPKGDCFIDQVPSTPLVLIAASTGFTQMKSIIEHLLPGGLAQPVTLFWGVLAAEDLYFREKCEQWCKADPNFRFVPVVSEPDASWDGLTGLVGEIALEEIDNPADISVVVSGSPAMVYATFDAFVEAGMPPENMRSDVFAYAPRARKADS